MWVTKHLMVPIDFHSISPHTIEVIGDHWQREDEYIRIFFFTIHLS